MAIPSHGSTRSDAGWLAVTCSGSSLSSRPPPPGGFRRAKIRPPARIVASFRVAGQRPTVGRPAYVRGRRRATRAGQARPRGVDKRSHGSLASAKGVLELSDSPPGIHVANGPALQQLLQVS